MNKLFESRNILSSTTTKIPSADAEIIFTRAPFIQYEQILLEKNLRQHLETIMVSKKIIRMGAQKTLIQCDWIEISIVPDTSNKHTSIYDSYNRKMAAQLIKTLQLSNFTEICSLTNEKRYNIDNLTKKHLLYKQFVA